MVSCGDTREEYSGYEIELWKMGVKDFTQGDDSAFPYEFTCWPWTAMLEEAVSPDTVCDFVVAGVSRLGDMEDSEDVQWSWTTYRSGFSILTLEQSQQSTDYFSMFAPFDFHVWLLFISTSAFMGVLIWLADFILGYHNLEGHGLGGYVPDHYTYPKKFLHGLYEALWVGLRSGVGFDPPNPVSLAARTVAYGYHFVNQIVLSLYTANLASILTTNRLKSGIESWKDLQRATVAAHDAEQAVILSHLGINTVGYVWETDEDEELMIQDLRAGKVDAFIIDTPFAHATAANVCDLRVVDKQQMLVSHAVAFLNRTSLDQFGFSLEIFNRFLERMYKQGVIEDLDERFIQQGSCGDDGTEEEDTEQVHLDDVAGLWLLLCASILMSAMLLCVRHRSRLKLRMSRISRAESSKTIDKAYTHEEFSTPTLTNNYIPSDETPRWQGVDDKESQAISVFDAIKSSRDLKDLSERVQGFESRLDEAMTDMQAMMQAMALQQKQFGDHLLKLREEMRDLKRCVLLCFVEAVSLVQLVAAKCSLVPGTTGAIRIGGGVAPSVRCQEVERMRV
ncbi:hypothetical protein CYMTET_37508 [Cymbomonas tetramitiformis]|uniref:Ionotropic glutamate receptor C-terminal domain-containing protein n=1 Tax=Cymbomonas tetramitiformis TaxID=36881 RepID=A0AAE0CF54_9CHLO|nr:hypothetical protein CYMTET_37508 [Cymbomonas tetramitiformis]